MKQLIFILIFLAGLLTVEGLYILFKDIYRRRTEQLRKRMLYFSREGIKERPSIWREQRLSQIGLINNLLSHLRFAFFIERLLGQANMKIRVDRFLLIIIGFLILFGMLTYLLGHSILIFVPGGLIGGSIPIGYLFYTKRRRCKQFIERFPEALDLMARSLRVGYALPHTFESIAKEFPGPLSTEFAGIYEEYSLGVPLKDALERMEKRLGILEVKLFVTSLLIQKEVGGNLSEILENLGHIIRERDKLRRQARALTAEGRFTGWIIGILPIVVGGILFLINPEYIKILFTHPTGKVLLGLAITMELLGAMLIKKIVTVRG